MNENQYNKFKLKQNFLAIINNPKYKNSKKVVYKSAIDQIFFQGILNIQDLSGNIARALIASGVDEKECIEDFKFVVNYLFDNKINTEPFDSLLSHIFDYMIANPVKNICIEHFIEKRGLTVPGLRSLIKSKGVIGSIQSWDLLDEYEAKLILKEKQLLDANLPTQSVVHSKSASPDFKI